MDTLSSGLTKELYDMLQPESKLFVDLCLRLIQVHLIKAQDYGNDNSPLGNFEAAVDLGLTPLQGILVRMSDKWARIQTFMKRGQLKNESFDDSLIDLAAYSLLALVVHRRPNGPK